MVVQFQTSFIPKKAPVMAAPTSGAGGRSMNLLAIIAFIAFSVTSCLAAAAFFYKAHLVKAILDMDVSLAAAKKSFEPEFISEASQLDTRIEGVRELLSKHIALSPLFDILEKKTLENVRFQDFTFTVADKKITLAMTGQAKSFNAVALQSDVFGTETAFKDPIFSNFTLDDQGDVIFNFQTSVDRSLLLYRETVLGSAAAKGGNSAVPSVE